ncbi:MAG: hypothetical protein IJR65_01190 [Oscillospiraceae bacterium]|nr:hypothetical protein [Oscillospiraceae bacterium]
MKRIALVLVLALVVGLLTGCGGSVRNDVPAADVASAVRSALGMDDSLVSMDGTFLGLVGKSADEIGEHEILVCNSTTIDELGVLRAGTMSAKDLEALAKDYLASYTEKRWPMVELYNPDEEPKLTEAEVVVLGDYVMYMILSEADRGVATEAFKKALK